MTDPNTKEIVQFAFWKQIVLHLTPGLLAIGLFVLFSDIFLPFRWPPFLILQIVLPVLILTEIAIILFENQSRTGRYAFSRVITYTSKIKWWELSLFSLVSIAWVIAIYSTFGNQLNEFIRSNYFGWFPDSLQIGKLFEQPALYSQGVRLTVWLLTLFFGALIGPFVEELYFRGFLLPRMQYLGWAAPFIATILMAVYHFWTPWLIPLRVLAMTPMVYFVWWKRNIVIGIIAHCALNLMSDVIMTIPILLS